MSSETTLDIGKLHIDWGQNEIFTNHSSLFLLSDRSTADYYYVDENGKEISETHEALVSKLVKVKGRLELIGYSLDKVERRFYDYLRYQNSSPPIMKLTYGGFRDSMLAADLSRLESIKDVEINVSFDEEELTEYARTLHHQDVQFVSEWLREIRRKEFFENIDPYIILRLLAENPKNYDLPLIWRYYDIVEGGYVAFEDIYIPLSDRQKYLLVTEGSTDTYILRESINKLEPEIADFFRFIDMEENYPFTGAGNLFRFCQGLASIGIQNRVIVVFDNDTEGLEKYNLTKSLNMPCQMNVMHLPDLDDFNEVECIGPNGTSKENINGRAVSIECYLDFKSTHRKPRIRWTAYNQRTSTYQGELENKSDYIKAFRKKKNDDSYDFTKLRALVSAIYSTCISTPNPIDQDY